MNWLVILYAVFYSAISLGGIWSDFKERYSAWIIVLDIIASVIGLTGMVLYQLDLNDQILKNAWKLALLVLVAASLFVASIDTYDEWKKEPAENKELALAAALTLISELPCFYINYLFAFN